MSLLNVTLKLRASVRFLHSYGFWFGRETPYGGNFGILSLSDHLIAQKKLYNTLQERENI